MDNVFVKVKYKMVSEPDFHQYPISGTIPGHLQSAAVPGDFDLSKSYIVVLTVFEGGLDEPSSQSEPLYVPLGGKTFFFSLSLALYLYIAAHVLIKNTMEVLEQFY